MSIVDERTGITHDYTRHKSPVLWSGLYCPKDSPEWTQDRAKLWNHVEAFEKHRSAQVARTIEISLPHELTLEQQRYAVQDFIRENFTRKGLIADAAIHAPAPGTDERNVHAHIMFVTRKLDGSEFCNRKVDRADSLTDFKAAQLKELEGWRESWETIGNRHLKRHGHEPTLDRRTLEAQQIDRTPGVHKGKKVCQMEARGLRTDRGDMQREAANQNEAREWIEMRQAGAAELGRDDDRAALEAELEAGRRHDERMFRRDPHEIAAEQAQPSPADPLREQIREQVATIREQRQDARAAGRQEARSEVLAEADRSRRDNAPERELRQALEALAITDPLRFGDAARAAREASFLRAVPSPVTPSMPQAPEPVRERIMEAPAPAETWRDQMGGWKKLSDVQKTAAQNSHDAWKAKRGDRESFDLPDYVDFVQHRQAKAREAEQHKAAGLAPSMPVEIEQPRECTVEPTPVAPTNPTPLNTAAPVKPLQLGLSISYTLPGMPERPQEPAREAGAARPVSRGTDLPEASPEATQRASYEAEKPEPARARGKFHKMEVERAPEPDARASPGWREKAVKAGWAMLARLAVRVEHGIEARRERRQAELERQRAEPQLSASSPDFTWKVHADPGEVRYVFDQPRPEPAAQPEPRPHMRVRSYLAHEPVQQQPESVRRQEPAHAPAPPPSPESTRPARETWDEFIKRKTREAEAERASETPQQRQAREHEDRDGSRERHHHMPFLHDVLGFVRKHYYGRHHHD